MTDKPVAEKATKKPSSTQRRGSGFLIAKRSFQVPGPRLVKEGEVVEADDPIVKGREALFEKAEDRLRTR